jgi:group I intron endonuclease
MGIIYKLTSPSGKSYIGQTTLTLQERWNQHIYKAKHHYDNCRKLNNAIRKYGENSFINEVLLICDDKDLNMFETKMICVYDTLTPNGYNLLTGGSNGKRSDDSKEAISLGLLKRNETYVYKRTNEHSLGLPKYISYYKGSKGEGFRIRGHPKCDNKIFCSKIISLDIIKTKILDYLHKIENDEDVNKHNHIQGTPKGVQKTDRGYRVVWTSYENKMKAKYWYDKKYTMEQKLHFAITFANNINTTQNAVQRLNGSRLFSDSIKLLILEWLKI